MKLYNYFFSNLKFRPEILVKKATNLIGRLSENYISKIIRLKNCVKNFLNSPYIYVYLFIILIFIYHLSINVIATIIARPQSGNNS